MKAIKEEGGRTQQSESRVRRRKNEEAETRNLFSHRSDAGGSVRPKRKSIGISIETARLSEMKAASGEARRNWQAVNALPLDANPYLLYNIGKPFVKGFRARFASSDLQRPYLHSLAPI